MVFRNIVAVSFIGGGNWSTQRKPPTCCISDKLYDIMLYAYPARVGFALTTLVVLGSDCIGSCTSNPPTITTAPVAI